MGFLTPSGGGTVTGISSVPGLQAALDALQDAATAATDTELSAAVATLNASLGGKQDAASASTDAELAAAVATINTSLAAKQDASGAATDAELASAVATVNASVSAKLDASLLGQPNGVASLDAGGKVPASLLPAGIGSADGKVLYGTGAPASGTGNDGDSYVDTTNNRLYGPKAAGAWPGTYIALGGGASNTVGSYAIVHPSGDATGAADRTAINAALATGDVWLTGDFTVDQPVRIPSDRNLVLADAKITNAASLKTPVLTNTQWDVGAGNTGDARINVRGIGRAIIDHNGAQNAQDTTHLWKSTCVCFVNVDDFTVEDVQVQNSTYVGFMGQICTNGRIRNLHMNKGTDLGYIHVSTGSSNVVVEGVTAKGTFRDSVITIAAAQPNWYSAPYTATLAGAALQCTGIAFRNVTIDSQQNMVNMLCDANAGVSNCTFDNFHNTHNGTITGLSAVNEFWMGPSAYTGPTGATLSAPVNGQAVNGIRISNYTTAAPTNFLKVDTPIQDVHVSGVRYTSTQGALQFITFDRAIPAGMNPRIDRLKITDVDIPVLSQAFMQMQAGWRIDGVEIENLTIGTASAGLLKNACDITGLKLKTIRVGTLSSAPFQSTGVETGEVADFQYSRKGANLGALFFTAPPGLKIVQPFPSLAASDLTPLPLQGSEINCHPGKDPTGGAATTGGAYIGDGQAWNLVKSFNSVFRPSQLYVPTLFHYDARTLQALGLADGAAVAKWPDVSGGGVTLVQATVANQPIFVAADATLNNQPAVRFADATDYLQNTLLQTVSSAQPFTVFVVFYYATGLAGSIVWDGASASGGSATDGPLLYRPGNMMVYAGTANAGNVAAAATTPYVATAGWNAGNGYLGLNKAAFASIPNGSSGVRTITGVTLGQNYNASGVGGNLTIAEVVGFPKLMSVEYATIAAGLAAKYGITLS